MNMGHRPRATLSWPTFVPRSHRCDRWPHRLNHSYVARFLCPTPRRAALTRDVPSIGWRRKQTHMHAVGRAPHGTRASTYVWMVSDRKLLRSAQRRLRMWTNSGSPRARVGDCCQWECPCLKRRAVFCT